MADETSQKPTPDSQATDEASQTSASQSRLARLQQRLKSAPQWVNAHRRLVTIAAAGFILVSGVAAWLLIRNSEEVITVDQRLARALQALDHGDTNRARYEAGVVNRTPGLSSEQISTVAFILGALAAREAERLLGENSKLRYLVAARYLEQSYDRGFPKGYEGLGMYLFGKSLFESGQTPASRPILERALNAYPQRRSEIHRLLAIAYLSDPHAPPEKALAHIDRFLDDQRLQPAVRHEGLLLRARILLRMQDLAACQEALDQIPERSSLLSEVLLLRAQVLMRRAAQQAEAAESSPEALYRQAIDLLQRSQERDTLRNRTTPRAMYLVGVCLHRLGDDRAALAQWDRVRKLYFETPEGLAAAVEVGDQLQRLGKADEALEAYRDALSQVVDMADFQNPWLSLAEFRRRALLAYDRWIAERRFKTALELVEAMRSLLPAERVLQLEAEAHRAWGEHLLALSAKQAPQQAGQTRHEAYAEFRRSGEAFRRLADARRVTRHYPDDLWNAAQGYLRGKAYSTAAVLLEEYLEIELRQRRPLALVAYGEALLALGRLEPALDALGECLERFPRDAASFDARLLAAQAHLEQGETEKAETLLLENLEGDLLTPAARQWRQSLLRLGRLYHLEKRYDEAIDRLDEYVARYENDPRAFEARYLSALSSRRRAGQLLEELDQEKVETARQASLRVIRRYLQQALQHFVALQTGLNDLQANRPLSAAEAAMLRNCYLSRGAVLVDLQRYDEAIDVYGTATNRYQHEPVALEAYVQIAHCYQRLNRPDDARGVLAQARIVLERMPEDAQFTETTNFSRDQWQELLVSLQSFALAP